MVALCKFAGVTPRLFEALLDHFGNLERIMRADSGKLMTIDGMDSETANDITNSRSYFERAQEYLKSLERREIGIVTRFDSQYPNLLFELNDPPALLYFRGRLPDNNSKRVALVGAENSSSEGLELTSELSRRFAAREVQIISSLRKGIDAAAHLGGQNGKSHSLCVLDSGLDNVYPKEHLPLAIDIVQNGGLLTEYPPESDFSTRNYKASNRIIVGLSQAVVVTEVYKDSKSTLDILKCCSELGKLTFLMVDPKHSALADKASFDQAVSYGAIPMVGIQKVDDIVQSLV